MIHTTSSGRQLLLVVSSKGNFHRTVLIVIVLIPVLRLVHGCHWCFQMELPGKFGREKESLSCEGGVHCTTAEENPYLMLAVISQTTQVS